MDYRLAIEAALDYAKKKGVDHIEVFVNNTRLMRISSHEQKINDLKFSNSHGMSVRIIHNGSCSRIYTESITLPDIHHMVDQAVEFSKVAPINEEFVFSNPSDLQKQDFKIIGSSLEDVDIRLKKEQALRVEQILQEQNIPDVEITHAFYGDFQNMVYLGNSNGILAGYSEERCELLCGVKALRDDLMSLYAATQTSRDFASLDAEHLVTDVISCSIRLLGAHKPENGIYSVIFGPKAMSEFLRVFSPVFFADSQELSKLYGKIGQSLSSVLLTIKDDPTIPQAGMRFIDDEGYPCTSRVILEKGIFKNYLYNNAAASRMELQEGGNAFRRSFKTRVITAASNMYIENGATSRIDLISEMGTGIYIEELQGLEGTFHWEYPEYSIRARGFMVEKGEIAYPIHEFTINGTFLDFLNDVVKLGNDFTWGPAMNRQCFGAPSVLVQKIGVSA